jgi:DNA-binding transcriptional MerR regulator
VSNRTYLSIGDVLTLLREEFPDVTISKIRFLESQGLVNPERSPSGYRKFFEADVERLRWVLRQQREHFLPLKVIRDRLAAGDLSEVEVEETAGVEPVERNGAGAVAHPAHAGAGAKAGSEARATARAGSAGRAGGGAGSGGGGGAGDPDPGSGRTEAQLVQADNEAMARILADASRRTALIPEGANERTPLRVVTDANPASDDRESDAAATHSPPTPTATPTATPTPTPTPTPTATPTPTPTATVSASVSPASTSSVAPAPASSPAGAGSSPRHAAAVGVGAGGESTGEASAGTSVASDAGTGAATDAGTSGAASRPKGATSGSRESTTRRPSRGAEPAEKPAASGGPPSGGAAPPKASSTSGMVSGASLTADELCAATGLSGEELSGLQGFGLVEPVVLAGIPTFDEDALTVANLAADFRKYGIEPRHLRLYRNAVDREIGLIEQVIIPLLRQRNPESRQRAVDAADELGTLGQTLRATLLRAALRRHVGG